MNSIKLLCIVLCLILNNNEVQSEHCNLCECKPNKMTFACDCTQKTTEKNCFKERSNKITISNEELLIPVGNVNISMIEEFEIHDILISELNSVKSNIRLESLKRFILNSCQTRKIDKYAFFDMRRLIRLEIENNYISSFEPDTFIFTEKLEILKLRNNLIDSLSPEIFKKLNNLSDISLDNNKIQILPENIFRNKHNLKFVSLSNNKIIEISETIFTTNVKIEKIFFNNNLIRKLPASIFENHNNIFEINFSNNEIQILPNGLFRNLSNLRLVKLQNNKISLIENETFYNNVNLQALYLNDNKLKNIEPNVLVHSLKLQFLNLKNNLIRCDCTLINFFNIFQTRNMQSNIQCEEPNRLKNKDFKTLKQDDLICPAKLLNCLNTTKIDGYNHVTTISCKYEGYPKPVSSWTLNKEQIANKNYKISNIDTSNYSFWSNLTILNTTTFTKGFYYLDINNKGGNDTYSYYLEYNEEINLRKAIIFGTVGAVIILIFLFILIGWICWKHKREYGQYYPNDEENYDKIELQPRLQQIPNQLTKPRKRSTNSNSELTYRRFDSYYTDMPQIIPKTDLVINISTEDIPGRFTDTSRQVYKLYSRTNSKCPKEFDGQTHSECLKKFDEQTHSESPKEFHRQTHSECSKKFDERTHSECPKEFDESKKDGIVDETVLPREKYETIEQWFRKSDPLNVEVTKIIAIENTSHNDNVPEDINIEKALNIIKRNSNYMYDAIENEDKRLTYEEVYNEIEDINNNRFKNEHDVLINEMIAASSERLDIAANSEIFKNGSIQNFSQSKSKSEAYIFEEHSSHNMSMVVEKHQSEYTFSSFSHHSKEIIEETIQVIKSNHSSSSDNS